jgi:hypothetical protein
MFRKENFIIILQEHAIKKFLFFYNYWGKVYFLLQWQTLNVIMVIVIILLMLSQWPHPKLLLLAFLKQWKPFNVITDNVIIRLIWSNWTCPNLFITFLMSVSIQLLIIIFHLLLSVFLGPKVVILSGFQCISMICLLLAFGTHYKSGSVQKWSHLRG